MDYLALLARPGVSARGDHYANGGPLIPFGALAIECSVQARLEQIEQVAAKPPNEHLGLRIANRQLNSSTLGPSSVSISPGNNIPRNPIPSALMPAMKRSRISVFTRSIKVALIVPDGETVPMPPVLGPWFPSNARLWSLATGKRV